MICITGRKGSRFKGLLATHRDDKMAVIARSISDEAILFSNAVSNLDSYVPEGILIVPGSRSSG